MDTNTNRSSAPKLKQFPLPAPQLERLNIFVGRWYSEGDSYVDSQTENNPHAPALKWVSKETYEWMSGRYFLVHRWDAKVGDRPLKGVEIIGYDVAMKQYFSRLFDNSGNTVKYAVNLHNNTWRFMEPHTRTKLVFSNQGNTMSLHREWKHEGGDWLTLCSRKAVKVS